jgi:hypothetical protein
MLVASGFGLQASGGQTISMDPSGASAPAWHAQHGGPAELVAMYGELIRGLQRLLGAPRPEA